MQHFHTRNEFAHLVLI